MKTYTKQRFIDDLLELLQLEDEIHIENNFEFKNATVFIKGSINCDYELDEGSYNVKSVKCNLSEITVQYEAKEYRYSMTEIDDIENKIETHLKK